MPGILEALNLTREQASDLLQSAYKDKTFTYRTKLYLELSYLQDLRLGVLLSLANTKAKSAYLYSQIPSYNKRYYSECAKYFPKFKVTDEWIDETLSDPKNLLKVVKMAPLTGAYFAALQNIAEFTRYNYSVGDKVPPYEVLLNIHPLNLHPERVSRETVEILARHLRNMLGQLIPVKWHLSLADYHTKDMPFSTFMNLDFVMVENLQDLLSDEKKQHAVLIQGKYEYTTLLTARRTEIPDIETELEEEQRERLFSTGESVMGSGVSIYSYADPVIVTAAMLEGDTMDPETQSAPPRE